jgi:hypothetical protein
LNKLFNPIQSKNPFNLADDKTYQSWRARKLENYPQHKSELIVEVNDPRRLSRVEHEAILARCQTANMAIYASPIKEADKAIPRELGKQFHLTQLDSNICADDDGITSLKIVEGGKRQTYIPYTNKPIHWHTDGYYNTQEKQIYGMILHCVNPALTGGENALLDHEIAYIKLRDENPDYIHALMQPDAMCIPANVEAGKEIRPTCCGPVFSVTPTGTLHTRYTKRTRSITWKSDETTLAAVKFLEDLLDSDSPDIFKTTLQAGQGLICNNVLHNRTGFTDDANQQRLFYRARYYQRIAET